MKYLKISIIISLALHAYLLFFSNIAEKEPEQEQQGLRYNGNGDHEYKPKDIWFSQGSKRCDSYEGIGIVYGFMTNAIIKVAPGSPADKAGMKKDDIIITPIWNMEFKFGETVVILLDRGGKKIKVKVLIDRICQE